MRNLLLLASGLLLSLQSLAVRGFFTYSVFQDPNQKPYIECVTSFDGPTFLLQPAGNSGLYFSTAELTIIISKADKVIDFRKVNVDGPYVGKGQHADFMSLERFSLPEGIYDLEIVMHDKALPVGVEEESMKQSISVFSMGSSPAVSDIQFVAAYRPSDSATAFSKSGLDILPYNSNYFPSSLNEMIFYSELYNTEKSFGAGAAFVSSVCIVDLDEKMYEECRKIKREKAAAIVPVLQKLDISKLPSGEYKLRIEIRDKNNNLVATKDRPFSRNNVGLLTNLHPDAETPDFPISMISMSFAGRYQNADSLYALIQYHLPIASALEKITIDNQLVTRDLQQMQSFLYSFWYKRNPNDPEGDYLQYKKQIDYVESQYASRQKAGWRTDRGRIYLCYGPPKTMVVRNNDSDYWPFEIWHYYETRNNLHDRRFLFYDTTLSGDKELLHSDVPEEMKNFNWKQMVRSRPTAVNSASPSELNANQMRDPYSGDELEDLWYNPH